LYDYQTKDVMRIGIWKYNEAKYLAAFWTMSADNGVRGVKIPKMGRTDT
jgi:hypothetical protein